MVSRKDLPQILLSSTLIAVTVLYTAATMNMAALMGQTNRAELRPYLYIKFLAMPYFQYDNTDNKWKLLYTLKNDGKVSATEIIRSYKVYKINGDKAAISRPAYVNTDFVFALAPQETLEGQPDNIDGIGFSEQDISNHSYYLIELYVSYNGTESPPGTTYYSKVEIKVLPVSRNSGNWKYVLYLMHRDEGIDQNLEKFSAWRDSSSPEMLGRSNILSRTYKEGAQAQMATNIQTKSKYSPNRVSADLFGSSFYYFNSTFAQSIAALFALFGIFLIFRFEWENQKLFRTYDIAKHAVGHSHCLDKDVKFYLLKHSIVNCGSKAARGARDIRIQIYNLEEVLHSMYKSIRMPALVFALLFLVSLLSFAYSDYQNNKNLMYSAGYGIFVFLLFLSLLWLFLRAHKLSRNMKDFTFNTENSYEQFEEGAGLAKGDFLYVAESIDLIERDILEFTDFPFVMNFAFKGVEDAIRRRKERLRILNELETKIYITINKLFFLEASEGVPENKKEEIDQIVCDENRDRSQIIVYLANKYPACKVVINDLFFKIHSEIKSKLSGKTNK